VSGVFLSLLLKGNDIVKKESTEKSNSFDKENNKERRAELRRIILIFCITNILNGLLNGFINPVLNGLLLFKLEAAPAMYGLVLSLSSSLVTGLVQLPGGKLADRFGRKPLVLFGFLGVPLILLLGFSRSLLEFSLIMGGISAVGNISSPAISAWLMDLIPERKRVSVSGITQTFNGVGLTVGPNLGSYAWNATKPDAVIPVSISAVIFVSALPFYLVLKETAKVADEPKQTPNTSDS